MNFASFLSALKWSTFSELAAKVIQPVVFIVLARILTPDDYGVMATAMMVISFAQIFWDAGMARAIIQRQGDISLAASVAFWINFFIALLFAACLIISSDFIAVTFFKNAKVGLVLRVMSSQIILGALGSIHTAILQRELKFKKLFWVRLTTVIVPAFLSIPLAIAGMSYWALVAGTILGQFFQVIFLWKISGWTPELKLEKKTAIELLKFGSWVSLTGFLVWFYLWADSFVVGTYLGTYQLGLFRTGNTFVILIFDGILFGPLLPVLYSYFSGLNGDTERIQEICSKLIKIIAVIGIPISLLLFAVAEPVTEIIFGEKWTGIGSVVAVISIMRGYGWLAGINGDTYRAIGKPHIETLVYAISIIFFAIGFIISVQYGFGVFLITRLSLGLMTLIPHFILFRRYFRLPLIPILKITVTSSIVGLIPVLINFILQNCYQLNPFFHTTIVGAMSIPLMATGMYFLERTFIIRLFSDFKGHFTK